MKGSVLEGIVGGIYRVKAREGVRGSPGVEADVPEPLYAAPPM